MWIKIWIIMHRYNSDSQIFITQTIQLPELPGPEKGGNMLLQNVSTTYLLIWNKYCSC